MRGDLQRWNDIGLAVDEIFDRDETGRSEPDATVHDSRLQALALEAVRGETPLDQPLAAGFDLLLDQALTDHLPAGLRIGEEVGSYRVERLLGEGGMGTVFLAQRADGSFDHEVALKLLHRGPADAQAHSRFHRERQILAGLRHPNIARLLDGGVLRGMPYLVMEWVDGQPLTEFCEQRRLGPEERLRLVLQACDAVRYAHRQGVVHRDLKPSNLLVEAGPDGEARVVVLDFGVALLEHSEEPVTVTGQIFGTPGYMSPEQALGKRSEIDRRSDVYSLGVLLYELLSGHRPFAGEDAHEILHKVMVGEPTPLRQHLPQVSADLETIVETCLARRPVHRYDSVRALAEDLGSYLDGLPIVARPLGWGERWWRRARRRPRIAALVVAAVSVTLTSLVLLAFSALRYTRDLAVERNAALEARREAEGLLDFMLTDLHDGLDQLGRLDLLEQVAQRSLEYYERWPADASADGVERRAAAVHNTGQVLKDRGDLEGALDAYGRNLRLFSRLAETDPDPRWQFQLARCHEAMAETLADMAETSKALAHAEAAVALSRRFTTREPAREDGAELHFDALATHGWIVGESVSTGEAAAILEEARAFAASRVDSGGGASWQHKEAVARSYLGLNSLAAGDPEEALDDFLAARQQCETLVAREPANNLWREELQLVFGRLGAALNDLGRLDEAVSMFEAARRQSEILLQLEPGNVGWVRELAVVHASLAAARRREGDLAGALIDLEASLAITRSLSRRFPDNDSAQNDLAWDLVDLGRIHQALGEPREAERAWIEAAEVMHEVRRRNPAVSSYYLDTEVQALLELGRVEEARPLVRRLQQAGWTDPDLLVLYELHGLGADALSAGE